MSATPLSAPFVLARCVPVLIAHRCGFKFASTVDDAEAITSMRGSRVQGGKFLTAYPPDDEVFAALVHELHDATYGLPGQAILSDRRYRPDSLVHYRYGAFSGVTVRDNEGVLQSRLRAPDGTLVPDERREAFAPPAWAPAPPGGIGVSQELAVDGPDRPTEILLADRFVVHGAIRHANRGGVYRATDRQTGRNVVVKQARPHTGADLTGQDARDALWHAGEMLEQLDGLGPAKIAAFDQDGDLFLVEEEVPGVALWDWAQERRSQGNDVEPALDLPTMVSAATKLVDVLDAVHARGFVCRDFTPTNIMVTPQGDFLLIDTELVNRPGQPVRREYTPGFAAPEQVCMPKLAPCPPRAVDLYALGAVLYFLAVGTSLHLLEEEPATRTIRERCADLLRLAGERNLTAAAFTDTILGLVADDPAERWELHRVRTELGALAPMTTIGRTAPPLVHGISRQAARDRTLSDGLAFLAETMQPAATRLWPSGSFGARTEPANVQHGAAGVLGVLTRAARHQPELRDPVARAAAWTADRLEHIDRHLPGLYFGSAGAVWALVDAADLLEDTALRDRALRAAEHVPHRWPNPDVCHGAAGAGMTLLHLADRGAEHLMTRVLDCADALISQVGQNPPHWKIPDDFDSSLAGTVHHGFAHGTAGIANFLLAAGIRTGRDDYLDLARTAGDALVTAADRSQPGARWQAGVFGTPDRDEQHYHWCSGGSGIGTFLIRLWRHTGGADYLEAAQAAAQGSYRNRWQSTTAACHGLAGTGEFLLDLADAVGGDHRARAEDIADLLTARHAVRGGRWLIPDESGSAVHADFNTGLAGVLGFLHRLHHGGPRWWMNASPEMSGTPSGVPAD
ncbi:serine/threonine protein kinase [Longispora fulva]|nr:serine/threonine protein kinase [Longispora fulva]